MNQGVFNKSCREICVPTLMFGLGLLLSEVLLSFVLPQVEKEFTGLIAQMPFFQTIFKALLGTTISDSMGPAALQSIAWVDPVVLAIIWAHAIVVCTRIPAGEIDRGTADVLLGLPLSRRQVYLSDTAATIGSGVVVLALGWLGHAIGGALAPTSLHLHTGRLVIILVNLYALGIAVGGLAYLSSALSDRKGRAMATVFAIVVASFLLNFLAQFWQPAEKISFLGMMNYYRPVMVIQDGEWPWQNIMVLTAVGIVAWLIGGVAFSRRDIATT